MNAASYAGRRLWSKVREQQISLGLVFSAEKRRTDNASQGRKQQGSEEKDEREQDQAHRRLEHFHDFWRWRRGQASEGLLHKVEYPLVHALALMKDGGGYGDAQRESAAGEKSAERAQSGAQAKGDTARREATAVEQYAEEPGNHHAESRRKSEQDHHGDGARHHSQPGCPPRFREAQFTGERYVGSERAGIGGKTLRERSFRGNYADLRGVALRTERDPFFDARATLITGLLHRFSRYRSA